ncbi:MAG: hypothetical protein A2026_04870 [Deltaproteobacteria bacterium RBG_19FT_COMBO_46_12]|nr:MAG: hypothetical protein A2026_04870 [Deltaproteobacteria bacterium RBG_19FT_COMBO_46_12]
MPDKKDPIAAKALYPDARSKVREYVEKFFISLLLQAKIEAFNSSAETVLISHVDEAYRKIISPKRRTWFKQLSAIVGGALFGSAISIFASAYSGGNSFLMLLSMIFGFIGMFLVFLGIT